MTRIRNRQNHIPVIKAPTLIHAMAPLHFVRCEVYGSRIWNSTAQGSRPMVSGF